MTTLFVDGCIAIVVWCVFVVFFVSQDFWFMRHLWPAARLIWRSLYLIVVLPIFLGLLLWDSWPEIGDFIHEFMHMKAQPLPGARAKNVQP